MLIVIWKLPPEGESYTDAGCQLTPDTQPHAEVRKGAGSSRLPHDGNSKQPNGRRSGISFRECGWKRRGAPSTPPASARPTRNVGMMPNYAGRLQSHRPVNMAQSSRVRFRHGVVRAHCRRPAHSHGEARDPGHPPCRGVHCRSACGWPDARHLAHEKACPIPA